MKKILSSISFLALFAVLFISCDKEPIVIPFTIADHEECLVATTAFDYVSREFDLKKSDVLDKLATVNITDVSKVTTVKFADGLKVQVSGSGANLDEISNIEVYMKIKGTTGTGNQVAYSSPIAVGATEVEMKLNGVELKDILSNDMTFTVKFLNKAGGNAPICMKLTSGTINLTAKQ